MIMHSVKLLIIFLIIFQILVTFVDTAELRAIVLKSSLQWFQDHFPK